MSLKITDLNAITTVADDDVLHIRNSSGLDKKITYGNLKETIRQSVLPYESVAVNSVMANNHKYIVLDAIDFSLPSGSNIGDVIEVLVTDTTIIKQVDAEQSINYLSVNNTTIGITGEVELRAGEKIALIYRGLAVQITVPGTIIATPTPTVSYDGQFVDWTGDNSYLCLATTGVDDPYTFVYKKGTGDVFTEITPRPFTWGAGNNCTGVSWSRDGVYLVAGAFLSPYVQVVKRTGDTFSSLTLPGYAGTSCSRVAFDKVDGTYLALTGGAFEVYMSLYKRTGDTFAKLTDPTIKPGGQAYGIDFSHNNDYLAYAHTNSPYVTIYKRSGDTFTKLSDPASLPAGNGQSVSFSYDDNYLCVGHDGAPYYSIYKRSGDTFTKLSVPTLSPGPVDDMKCCSWNPNGVYLALATRTTPFVYLLERNGDTFTQITSPTSPTLDRTNGLRYSDDGTYLAVAFQYTSPYINIFKEKETVGKQYLMVSSDEDIASRMS